MPDRPGAAPLTVGRVGRPHGVRGEVTVRCDPDLDEPLRVGDVCWTDRDRAARLTVHDARPHRDGLVVAFEGFDAREHAERLRGAVLRRERRAEDLADDAVWVEDLLGRELRDGGGELVGVVADVVDGAAHDLLVVARPDGAEVLVPLVAELVDLADDGPLTVRAVPGLLDPDEAVVAAPDAEDDDRPSGRHLGGGQPEGG